MVEIATIFIVLNVLFFYGKHMSYKNPIFFGFIILFWPVFFLFLAFDMIRGWRQSGEKKYIAILRKLKVDSENWIHDNCAFLSLLGSINVKLSKEDLAFDEVRSKKILVHVSAILGTVTITVPREVVIISGRKVIMEKSRAQRVKNNDEDLENLLDDEEFTQILLKSRSILGKIRIKRV